MKNKLFVLFTLLIGSRLYAIKKDSVLNVSYSDALMLLMDNNPGLQAAALKVKEANAAKKAVRGFYMPEISINANVVALSEDLVLDLIPVKNAITPLYEALGNYGEFSGVPNPDPATASVMPVLPDNVSTQVVRQKLNDGRQEIENAEWERVIQEKHFGTVSAGFTLPIYAGGKIRTANHAAGVKEEIENEQFNHEKAKQISELSQRYYGVIMAKEVCIVRQKMVSTMKHHMDDAKMLMDQGMISRAEYLHSKMAHSNALVDLRKAEAKYQIAQSALKSSLGITDEIEIVPTSTLFKADTIFKASNFVQKAKNQNPVLCKIEKSKILANDGYKIERAELMPTVVAMGTYDLFNKNLSPYAPDYMVGVGLKWNIFKGGRNLNKLREARLKEEELAMVEQDVLSQIELGIINACNNLNVCKEQLNQIQTSLDFAKEYVRVQDKAFTEGMISSADVADAHLALAAIEIQKLGILFEFDITLAGLYSLSGMPDEFVRVTK